MSDLEHDLREMFRRGEGDAPTPDPIDARPIVRRTRRRQGATVAASALGVALLAVVSVAGIRALLTSDGATPANEPTTTTTINGISITHPESWTVFDPDDLELNGPPDLGSGLPHLVLAVSPVDQGELFGCPGLVEGAEPASLMTVQEQPLALAGTSSVPWPVTLEPLSFESEGATGIVEGPTGGCYPGWGFLRAGWTAAGRTFEARVGFSPDVSPDERAAVTAAFESMTFEPSTAGTTQAVIDEGVIAGEAWQLLATRTDDVLDLTLQTQDGGTGIAPLLDGEEPMGATFATHMVGTGDDARVVAFGLMPADVLDLEVTGDGAESFALRDIPDDLDANYDAFVAILRSDASVTLVGLGVDGEVITMVRLTASPAPIETPLPVQPPEVSPTHGGVVWGLYLAVGPTLDDADMEGAVRQAEELGYTPSSGDLACDDGAADALGVDVSSSGVAVYFATREDAEAATQFFDAWVGIARVTTYCLD